MKNNRRASSVGGGCTPRPNYLAALRKQHPEKLPDQLKRYVTNNLLSVLWTVILGIGGLLFLMYFWSIKYFPSDFNLNSAAALLAAVAITGIGWSMLLAGFLSLPGIVYLVLNNIDSKGKRLNERVDRELTTLLALPIIIATEFIFVISYTGLEWRVPAYFVLLLTSVIWIVSLWIRAGTGVKEKHEHFQKLGKGLCTSVLVGLLAFFPLLVILKLMTEYGKSHPDEVVSSWLIFFEAVVIVVFSNVLVAAPHKKWWPKLFIAFITLFITLLVTQQWSFLSGASVRVLKLGDVRNANLILDQQGCQIARRFKVFPASIVSATPSTSVVTTNESRVNDSSSEMCVLTCVNVLSRIGQEYYLEVPKQGQCPEKQVSQKHLDNPIQFVVPSSHVLSWSVPLLVSGTADTSKDAVTQTSGPR